KPIEDEVFNLIKKIFVWMSVVLLLIITGCSNDDEIAKELIDYYNNDWISAQKMKKENIGAKKLRLLKIENNEEASVFVEEEILRAWQQCSTIFIVLNSNIKKFKNYINYMSKQRNFPTNYLKMLQHILKAK